MKHHLHSPCVDYASEQMGYGDSCHGFADEVSQGIKHTLRNESYSVLTVRVATPRWSDDAEAQGYLEIVLSNGLGKEIDGVPSLATIGIKFGATELIDGILPLRQGFNTLAWMADNRNPLSTGIVAVCFDEAWRIICLTAFKMNIQTVRLGYCQQM